MLVITKVRYANFTGTRGKMSSRINIEEIRTTTIKIWEQYKNSPVGKALRNKFVATGVIFFIWLLLFDQNNLADRRKTTSQFNQLLSEKEYYEQKIVEDRKRINELKTNSENLEKFAREQYLMKKDNEDIFIIVDE
ncbi:MAG TPA: septum formation initiator family protein [Bacteroidales bacterium]|nr:septum formation initiator family protein [Bacteroidales bacterium]